jgi:hypothetical protein
MLSALLTQRGGGVEGSWLPAPLPQWHLGTVTTWSPSTNHNAGQFWGMILGSGSDLGAGQPRTPVVWASPAEASRGSDFQSSHLSPSPSFAWVFLSTRGWNMALALQESLAVLECRAGCTLDRQATLNFESTLKSSSA